MLYVYVCEVWYVYVCVYACIAVTCGMYMYSSMCVLQQRLICTCICLRMYCCDLWDVYACVYACTAVTFGMCMYTLTCVLQ